MGRTYSEETKEQARRMAAAGLNAAAVADQLGVSESAVRSWVAAADAEAPVRAVPSSGDLGDDLGAGASESVEVLREQLHSDNEPIRQGAARALLRSYATIQNTLAEQKKLDVLIAASDGAPMNRDELQDYLVALPPALLAAALEAQSSDA